MFCLESMEVCLKEVRCFLFPEPILLLPPKKSFQKKTYISYTNPWEPLYLLGFSGEGLGVGFGAGVGWILHFPYCSPCFCLFLGPNIRHFFVIPCRIQYKTARLLIVFSMTHRQNIQGGFYCIGGFYCGQIRFCVAGFTLPYPTPYHAKQGVKSAKKVLLV